MLGKVFQDFLEILEFRNEKLNSSRADILVRRKSLQDFDSPRKQFQSVFFGTSEFFHVPRYRTGTF